MARRKQEDTEDSRSAGVTNTKPDEAIRGAAENERLQNHPPPLVHVDPATGEPITKPLPKSQEANRNTVPGNTGVEDARPNNR